MTMMKATRHNGAARTALIEDAVHERLYRDLGIRFDDEFRFGILKGVEGLTDKWVVVVESRDIAPMTLGPFAPAIKEMTVTVSAARDDDKGYLLYYYSYDHAGGGSNGFEVRVEVLP